MPEERYIREGRERRKKRKETSKYPPAKPGALMGEPLKGADKSVSRLKAAAVDPFSHRERGLLTPTAV